MNSYYLVNLLIFVGVDIIACLALNLQFGVSGVVNFSFIIFQSAGAYAAAILSMPPDTAADFSFQTYVGGYQLAFPLQARDRIGQRAILRARCWPSRSVSWRCASSAVIIRRSRFWSHRSSPTP